MGKSRARNRAVLPKRESREREREWSRERVEKRGIRNRRKGEREQKERMHSKKKKKMKERGSRMTRRRERKTKQNE